MENKNLAKQIFEIQETTKQKLGSAQRSTEKFRTDTKYRRKINEGHEYVQKDNRGIQAGRKDQQSRSKSKLNTVCLLYTSRCV